MQEKLYTIKELSKIFGVSQMDIKRTVKKLTINSLKNNMFTIQQFQDIYSQINDSFIFKQNVTQDENAKRSEKMETNKNNEDLELNRIKDHTAELLPYFLTPAHKSGYICPNCGTLFNPNPTGRRKKFCSDECRLAWNHKHPRPERWKDTSRTAICPVCNKEFVVTREYKVKRKYCSRTCANKGRSGRSKTNGNKSCAT